MGAATSGRKQFARERAGDVIAEYEEQESGTENNRPELAKAIKRCRMTGATLLVAKLDRLSRDAAFLLTLQKGTVKFVAANLPSADETTVGFMAIIAQHEARAIGQRTRDALAAAKARGTKLGGFREKAAKIGDYQRQGVKALRSQADEDAEMVREDIEPLVHEGLTLRAIAEHLEKVGTLTPRSRKLFDAGRLTADNRAVWTARSVLNTINRLKIVRRSA